MRVVADTDVVISGMFLGGAPRRVGAMATTAEFFKGCLS